MVGEVLDYRHNASAAPLVFAAGSYAVSMQHPSSVPNESLKVPGEGFLGDYMLYLLRVAYTHCSSRLYPELMEQHGIAPEEWRSLTLLGDTGQADAEFLAQMVGQPDNVFEATVERMRDKGFVTESDGGQVRLTESGHDMATRLFQIAKAQEDLMLADLSAEQREHLKDGLKHVAQLEGHR